MKIRPLDFPSAEPIRNDHAPQTLPSIIEGSSLFADLGGSTGGLPVPTERSAFTVSAIYASVNLIAGAIAALPLHIYKRSLDGERDLLPDDALWWVLNEQMTPRWSAAAGWEFIIQGLLLHGDGFARIRRNALSAVIGLEPLHPNRVTVLVAEDGQRLVYLVYPDPLIPMASRGGVEVLDQDDMLHIPGFGFDGRRGLSPLRYALRMTGAVSLATQDYAARFFANGARPDYVLQTDTNMSPAAIEAMRDQVDQAHRGSANAHKPMVLTNGLKAEAIGMPIEEMQLLSTRQFQIEEIARIYGVPPFMIGHNEKTSSWGSGVEAMGIGFVRYALRQHLNKVQAEVNRKLFRTARRLAEFDTSELERADTTGLFAALRTAVGTAGAPGIMSVNEARARINLKKTPGGDELFKGTANAPPQAAEPAAGQP
jgi:HK97 family phage portal protein